MASMVAIGPRDQALMNRIDHLHLELPFVGARMLRDLLRQEDHKVGRSKCATDTHYIRSGEGWLYLTIAVDLSFGQVVSCSMSHSMYSRLVIRTVLLAL